MTILLAFSYCSIDIKFILYIQILRVLQSDLDIDNAVNRTWRYNSDTGAMLISFSLSFNLKTPQSDILTILQNVLVKNEASIIPAGFNLTKQGFQLLVFQSSCK